MVGRGPKCETSSIRKPSKAALAVTHHPVITFKISKSLMYVSLGFVCFDKVSLCIPGWLRTYYID